MANESLPTQSDELVDDDTIISLASIPVDHRDDDCDCVEED